MRIEGKGMVAPGPIKYSITFAELRQLLLEAERRANFRRYGKARTTWKQGLTGMREFQGLGMVRKDVSPILIGLAGEYVVIQHLNSRLRRAVFELDVSLLPSGDKGIDLQDSHITLQVKTRQTANTNLIRRVNERRILVPLRAEAHVFCRWKGHHIVDLLGWQWTKTIRQLSRLQKSPRAPHFNLVVPDELLQPMSALVTEIETSNENG